MMIKILGIVHQKKNMVQLIHLILQKLEKKEKNYQFQQQNV